MGENVADVNVTAEQINLPSKYSLEYNDLTDHNSGHTTPVLGQLTSSVFSEENIIDEPKEEDDSKDEMDELNAFRDKLIKDAAAKKAKKNISKSTDDDEEQNADSMSESITRARRGSAEDRIKDLASMLVPQSSSTTSMPPPKTTDRPATDGSAANRMLQSALGLNPGKKRVLI